MSARTRKWVESWDRIKDRPEQELKDYVLGKCRNGFQVAKKPSRDQRDAWVTLLAEPDKTRHQLSPLAMRLGWFHTGSRAILSASKNLSNSAGVKLARGAAQ